MRDLSPPSFPELFAKALMESAKRRSYMAYMPWFFSICVFLPILIFFVFCYNAAQPISRSECAMALSSIAVVGSFLGSSSVSIAGQMQKMVSEYPFSDYLREQGYFDLFLFWPQFTLVVQIVNIGLAGTFIMLMLVMRLDNFILLFSMLSFSFMIYTFKKTWDLVDLVRLVTWHYEDYKHQLETFNES